MMIDDDDKDDDGDDEDNYGGGEDGLYVITGQSHMRLWDDDDTGMLVEIMIQDETLFSIS